MKKTFIKGYSSFSTDLLTDISYELQDILKYSSDILYNFIGSNKLIAQAKNYMI